MKMVRQCPKATKGSVTGSNKATWRLWGWLILSLGGMYDPLTHMWADCSAHTSQVTAAPGKMMTADVEAPIEFVLTNKQDGWDKPSNGECTYPTGICRQAGTTEGHEARQSGTTKTVDVH